MLCHLKETKVSGCILCGVCRRTGCGLFCWWELLTTLRFDDSTTQPFATQIDANTIRICHSDNNFGLISVDLFVLFSSAPYGAQALKLPSRATMVTGSEFNRYVPILYCRGSASPHIHISAYRKHRPFSMSGHDWKLDGGRHMSQVSENRSGRKLQREETTSKFGQG